MTMTFDTHGANASLTSSYQNYNSESSSVTLRDCQDCPLCFHSKVFQEWSGYRDAFVSLSTRNFSCPICCSSIQGVDKFALHLVSHDLRAKIIRPPSSTLLSNNLATYAGQKMVNSDIIPTPSSLNHQIVNSNTDGSSVFSSMSSVRDDFECSKPTNFLQEESSILSQSKLPRNSEDLSIKQSFKDLEKAKGNPKLGLVSPESTKIELSNGTLNTHESLDQLLEDYSEFVRQQECNKSHSTTILGHRNDESIKNKMDDTFDMNCNNLKHDNFDVPTNNQSSSASSFNQAHLLFSSNISNNTPHNEPLTTQCQSKIVSSICNNPSTLISLQMEQFKTQSTTDINTKKLDLQPFHNLGNANTNPESNLSSSMQQTLFCPLTPNKNENRVPINVQVPKPLYYKHFSQSSSDTSSSAAIYSECQDLQAKDNSELWKTDENDEKEMDTIAPRNNSNISQDKSCIFSPQSKGILDSTLPNPGFESCKTNLKNDSNNSDPFANRENHLKKNENLSTSESSVQCSLCGWNFDDENFLQLHTVLMHSPHRKRGEQGGVLRVGKTRGIARRHVVESFHCRDCNKAFKLHEQYTQHLKLVHNDYRYVCNLCAKMFKLRGSLLVHVRVVHNPLDEEETDYHCGTCKRKFSSRHRRDIHEKKHEDSIVKHSEDFIIEGKEQLDANQQHDSIFSTKRSPIRKEETLPLNMHDVTGQVFNSTSEAKQTNDLVKIPSLMNTLVAGQNDVVEHKKLVKLVDHGQTTLKDKSILNDEQLPPRKNIPKHLSTENSHTFKCKLCEKTFKRQTHLHQHSLTHEPRQWDCDICKKTFTTKYFLKKHKRLHTGK